MSLILDAGALISFERGGRTVQAFLERAHRDDIEVRTTTAAVAQVWRDPARQVVLARLLRGVDERELTKPRARAIGVLLARGKRTDVVDASLVDAARDGDEVLTSDPGDVVNLAEAAGKTLVITRV